MLLKNLLLTEIVKVSKSQYEYTIIDLDTLDSFKITDEWVTHQRTSKVTESQFIKDVMADNGKHLIRCPLFFNAVYLKKDDNKIVQIPMTTDDLAIIPNGQVRGLNRIANAIDNLKGEEF